MFPYLTIIIAMLIWAGAGIAVKEALLVFTPLTLIVFRFTLAVLLMLLLMKVNTSGKLKPMMHREI